MLIDRELIIFPLFTKLYSYFRFEQIWQNIALLICIYCPQLFATQKRIESTLLQSKYWATLASKIIFWSCSSRDRDDNPCPSATAWNVQYSVRGGRGLYSGQTCVQCPLTPLSAAWAPAPGGHSPVLSCQWVTIHQPALHSSGLQRRPNSKSVLVPLDECIFRKWSHRWLRMS